MHHMSEPLSNNQTVNEAPSEPTASPLFIRNLTDLQAFRLANTEMRRLTDGREIRPITEAEWVAKATAANKSDKLIDRQSGMSGWITVEEGFHIMRKLAKVTDYDLTGVSSDKLEAPAPILEEGELEYDGPFGDRDFDVYAEAVGQIESGGRYDVVGGYNNHYQGKYQFGRAALKDVGVGFSAEARKAFLADPSLQEESFNSLTVQNHKTLLRLSGKYRKLSRREQLGILAMAHNAGAGSALEYLRSGTDSTDGFGTKGTRYINAVAKAFADAEVMS
jgi:hypothetical protein